MSGTRPIKRRRISSRLEQLKNESAGAQRFAEIERESTVMKINLSMAQADARFDLIAKGFDDLFAAMNEMAASDPIAFKHYVIQVNQFLTKTTKTLKRIEKD